MEGLATPSLAGSCIIRELLVLDCSCARRALARAGGPLAEAVKVSLVMVGWGSAALGAGAAAAAAATAAVAGACAAVGDAVEEGPAPVVVGVVASRLVVAPGAADVGATATTGAMLAPAS